MDGPVVIDPSKAAAAKAAYEASLRQSNPELIDGNGQLNAGDPFDVNSDGSVTFNRWTAGENKNSAQRAFFDDVEVDANGNKTTVRRPSWQSVPEYYNDEAKDQFDYISKALEQLQGKGFKRMRKLYKKALGKID